MVRYLKNTEIDREKWDRCIEGSVFETLYPYSWYLDLVNPGWDALVSGEYEIIMPLTSTIKYGFHMLLQPILAQQLGLFSADPVREGEIREFFAEISNRFRYVDLCLNRANHAIPGSLKSWERSNYEIDLGSVPLYNLNTKRNLQKGNANSFEFREIGISDYLNLKYARGEKVSVARTYLETLFEGLVKLKRAQGYGIFHKDQLHAAAVLGYAKSRVIYLNGCSSAHGKESRAMFVLTNLLIEHSKEKVPVFDFEGSEIPGVARFFEGFGGVRTVYYRIRQRKFPFTLLKG